MIQPELILFELIGIGMHLKWEDGSYVRWMEDIFIYPEDKGLMLEKIFGGSS